MSIALVQLWTVDCDGCDHELEDPEEGLLFFDTVDAAMAALLERGWVVDSGHNVVCNDLCHKRPGAASEGQS